MWNAMHAMHLAQDSGQWIWIAPLETLGLPREGSMAVSARTGTAPDLANAKAINHGAIAAA